MSHLKIRQLMHFREKFLIVLTIINSLRESGKMKSFLVCQ
jgi:hypothetical protein